MRILCLIGRETSYPRNDVILRAFRRFSEVEVISGGVSGSLIWRSLRVFFRALPRLITRRYDLVYVGFYGHILMLLAGSISRAPVLFDAFVSNFDTLCFDRGLYSPDSIVGKLAFWLDRSSCRLADRILLDTPMHVEYFEQTFSLSRDKMEHLPVGCNEDLFYPRNHKSSEIMTKVLYYSTYLPLHGVDIVVHAARILRQEGQLQFKIIGDGQEFGAVRSLAKNFGLTNVVFEEYIPIERLPDEIAAADICLGGHFGASDKACRVIPGKIYQFLAMERPVIAANTPANLSLLAHGETAFLCAANDSHALASAVMELYENPGWRGRLARNGHIRFLEEASERVITEKLRRILQDMMRAV